MILRKGPGVILTTLAVAIAFILVVSVSYSIFQGLNQVVVQAVIDHI